jgi:hypothetical protein
VTNKLRDEKPTPCEHKGLLIENYSKGWKLVELKSGGILPKDFQHWVNFIWGFDIWVFGVPLLKVEIALLILNLIVWR